jgi:hypothetical protein
LTAYQFSAIAGSSSCRISPASTIARYSSPHRVRARVEQVLVGLVVLVVHLPVHLGELEPAQALEHVRPPGAVVISLPHRVAVLAVVDDVDPALLLAPDHVGHGAGELAPEVVVAETGLGPPVVSRDQVLGAGQAADVAGPDAIWALGHGGSHRAVTYIAVTHRCFHQIGGPDTARALPAGPLKRCGGRARTPAPDPGKLGGGSRRRPGRIRP